MQKFASPVELCVAQRFSQATQGMVDIFSCPRRSARAGAVVVRMASSRAHGHRRTYQRHKIIFRNDKKM